MAKPPIMVHVQSSDFKSLLEAQRESLSSLRSMQMIMEQTREEQVAGLKPADKSSSMENEELLKVEKETLKISKSMAESLEDIKAAQIARDEMVEAVGNIAKTVKTFDTLGDKFRNMGMGRGLGEKFGSVAAVKSTALKAVNVGGFLNKKIAEREFVQQQRKLGSEKSDKDLREDFAARNTTAKQIKTNEGEIERLKSETGLTEKQLSATPEGKRLISKRETLSNAFAKTDIRASLVGKAESAGTPLSNKEQNDSVNVSEEEMESARRVENQTTILEKIEKNTAATSNAKAATPSEGSGGGILGGIGLALKSLGGGLAGLGRGAGAGIQALLFGLAKGLAALANPATLIGLGAVTLAVIGIGKALEMAAPGIEAFGNAAEKIISGIAEGIVAIVNSITEAIERLAAVDGMNLIQVGAGLVAVSAGMATFGAANAIAGVGNLVGGLLSKVSGQKSPVDQIIALGESGVNIEKAGIGVEKLGNGLKAFSSIDAEKIKAIAALPTDKIAAMGLAMSSANAVSSQSAANDSARTAAGGGSSGSNTAVNAPTTNISNTKQVIQLPVRNQEQTMNRYVRTRFA